MIEYLLQKSGKLFLTQLLQLWSLIENCEAINKHISQKYSFWLKFSVIRHYLSNFFVITKPHHFLSNVFFISTDQSKKSQIIIETFPCLLRGVVV